MFADLFRKLATLTRSPGLPVVRVRGWMWQQTPAGANLFGPDGPNVEQWVASRAAVVVKSGPARAVYRVELPTATVFVKHCKITGPRGWAREAIRPPKARLEFENALQLRDRGIPVVEPLAWGGPDSRWPGESVLVTRGLTAAVPLQHYLEHTLPALPPDEQRAVRRQLAITLAQFLAKLHDAGVVHPDPHPGNLLIETPLGSEPHFALIDLHAIRIDQPLSWPATRDNLVLYNRWFQLRATRPERTRFWRAYCQARATLTRAFAPDTSPAKELEQATHAANLCHWAGREARSVRANRYFRKIALDAARGYAVRDLSDQFLTQLLRDPDAAFSQPDTRILKDGDGSTVAELVMPTPRGPVPVILKRVKGSWIGAAKNLFRRSTLLRSWVNGHALRDRWLPTPRPLVVFHRHRLGVPAEGYLLTEMVPAAVGLDDAVRRCPDRVKLRELLHRVARMLRTMHDRGVSHRDLKAANVLVSVGGEPVLIDLVGARTRVQLTDAVRSRELARLNASFLSFPTVTRGERLRFLRAYLNAGPALGAGWKRWWAMVSQATAAKVAKNRRRGRMLG